MRRFMVLLSVVIASGVAFGLGRRAATPPDAVARGEGSPSSEGAAIGPDSIRAVRDAVRRRIADSDTYLGHALAEVDSVLRRWRKRTGSPLRIYFAPASAVRGYTGEHDEAARNAFRRWERVGAIPVIFEFVRDSSSAEVHVRWIEAFAIRRTGQADVAWDNEGWLARGTLTLATNSHDGWRVSPDVAYAVALHEIGHLLGLGHSDDPQDLMYPSTSARDLTPRDRRTARLLYALPPGPVRWP
jgi:hypothetical protein